MKKNKRWYQIWWVWMAIIAILFSAFTPQIIDWIYPKKGIWFSVTTFEKEQLLSFYGAYLAFIGTVALGALALWQNKKSNDISNRLLAIEEQNNIPYLEIIKNKSSIEQKEKILHIKLAVKNTTTKPIIYIRLSRYNHNGTTFFDDLYEDNPQKILSSIEKNNKKSTAILEWKLAECDQRFLQVNEECELTIDYDVSDNLNFTIPLKIHMENISKIKYEQTLYLIVNASNNFELVDYAVEVRKK